MSIVLTLYKQLLLWLAVLLLPFAGHFHVKSGTVDYTAQQLLWKEVSN